MPSAGCTRKVPRRVGGSMVVYCRKNKLDHNRLGLTGLGEAGPCQWSGNRARRRLREVYRLNAHRAAPGI